MRFVAKATKVTVKNHSGSLAKESTTNGYSSCGQKFLNLYSSTGYFTNRYLCGSIIYTCVCRVCIICLVVNQLPLDSYPSCLQTTAASALSHRSSQMVAPCHTPDWHTSTVPSVGSSPPNNLSSPSTHGVGGTKLKHTA